MEGTTVRFTDEHQVQHDALVTRVFGTPGEFPAVNVVFITDDAAKTDQYGRQVERKTSVVHKSKTPAPGYFYE